MLGELKCFGNALVVPRFVASIKVFLPPPRPLLIPMLLRKGVLQIYPFRQPIWAKAHCITGS